MDLGACGVMAVPRPVGAFRNTDGVDAKEIAGGLDIGGVPLRVCGARAIWVGGAVLQQHKGPKRAALRDGGRGLAGVVAAFGVILQRFAHVAELRAREHICAFRYAGDVGAVDVGGGLVYAF